LLGRPVGESAALAAQLVVLVAAEIGEAGQRIVAEIVALLIDLPADPGLFQALGIGGPREGGEIRMIARRVAAPIAVVDILDRLRPAMLGP
jgi:predicted secreted Zn-dependent protease